MLDLRKDILHAPDWEGKPLHGNSNLVTGAFNRAALCSRKFRSRPILAALFPTVFNGLIVGPVVYFAYVRAPGDPVSVPTLLINMGAVALGELVVCYVLGLPLLAGLRKLPDNVLNG